MYDPDIDRLQQALTASDIRMRERQDERVETRFQRLEDRHESRYDKLEERLRHVEQILACRESELAAWKILAPMIGLTILAIALPWILQAVSRVALHG